VASALARHDAWPWVPPRVPEPLVLAALPSLLAEALHLPFDTLREQHALAVQAGLIRRSMLESRDFERHLNVLEHVALGPFARQV
jgi:hypothetical protein